MVNNDLLGKKEFHSEIKINPEKSLKVQAKAWLMQQAGK